jgi:hypothetical protein
MAWDHTKKQEELALEAMNRGGIYRLVKVVPHDPAKGVQMRTKISGWITQEIWLKGRTPADLEKLLGFDSRSGSQYLQHGIDVFEITQKVQRGDFILGGAYTHLPGGKEWDGKDMHWPPGTGAVQWKLIKEVTCRFLKTVARNRKY